MENFVRFIERSMSTFILGISPFSAIWMMFTFLLFIFERTLKFYSLFWRLIAVCRLYALIYSIICTFHLNFTCIAILPIVLKKKCIIGKVAVKKAGLSMQYAFAEFLSLRSLIEVLPTVLSALRFVRFSWIYVVIVWRCASKCPARMSSFCPIFCVSSITI